MSSYKALMEQHDTLTEKRTQILAKAKSEGRVWNSDEMQEYANIETEQVKLLEEATRAQKYETELAALSQAGAEDRNRKATSGSAAASRNDELSDEEKSEAYRDWCLSADDAYRASLSAERRERARRAGYPVESNKTFVQRRPIAASPEHRAGQTVTTGGGGYTIPNEMMRAIDVALADFGGIYQVATVIRTATGATLPWPSINETSATAGAQLDINTATVEGAMTFTNVNLGAYKFTSKIVLMPMELMQDTFLNPGQFIGERLGERIARVVSRAFIRGSGSSAINGVATAVTSAATALTTDNAPTYAELLTCMHSVDPAYRRRPSCVWMFSDTVFKNIKAIVDGQSRPLWLPNIVAGAPEYLLGHKVIVNQDVDSAGTTGTISMLFGDFSKYIIREVADVEVHRLVERYAEYAQIGFVAFARYDGNLIDAGTAPIKAMKNP